MKYRVKKNKTPFLTRDEARTLLDSIAITRKVKDVDGKEKEIPWITGLRDRALLGTMLYTFAPVGASRAVMTLRAILVAASAPIKVLRQDCKLISSEAGDYISLPDRTEQSPGNDNE